MNRHGDQKKGQSPPLEHVAIGTTKSVNFNNLNIERLMYCNRMVIIYPKIFEGENFQGFQGFLPGLENFGHLLQILS